MDDAQTDPLPLDSVCVLRFVRIRASESNKRCSANLEPRQNGLDVRLNHHLVDATARVAGGPLKHFADSGGIDENEGVKLEPIPRRWPLPEDVDLP